MEKTIEIQEHGTMLADYFHGTPGVWINVSVDNTTTLKEVIEELENEINMTWDHVEHTAENHGYDVDRLESDIDKQLAEMREFIKGQDGKIYNPALEYSFDDDSVEFEELPAAIFTIEFVEV